VSDGAAGVSGSDQLLQATVQAIVTAVSAAVDAEPRPGVVSLSIPGGPAVGRQITIDATHAPQTEGLHNICRLSVLDPDLAPAGEMARLEYEHDKQTKFGLQRVYSIQSVRRYGADLVLLENFLAENAASVREEDFRPIESEAYAQGTVLATVQEWVHYRAWQLQQVASKG